MDKGGKVNVGRLLVAKKQSEANHYMSITETIRMRNGVVLK